MVEKSSLARGLLLKRKKEEIFNHLLAGLPPLRQVRSRKEDPLEGEMRLRRGEMQRCAAFHDEVRRGYKLEEEGRKPTNEEERKCLRLWREQSRVKMEHVLLGILRPNRVGV